MSVESWLSAGPDNVAVLHCLTGRGRTSTVLAAFLCWTGEAGFHDPIKALSYIAQCKRLDPDSLTIPSQRRYASYFANMLDGVRPSQPPLFLKRIIMSEAPRFGRRPPGPTQGGIADRGTTGTADDHDDDQDLGCAPYLQLFKAGQLVFTTAARMSYDQEKDDLPFCNPSNGQISFPVELVVQGDVLVRCRHLTRKGQRVSMFRAAFHTGYVPPKVLRLGKSQLDGACGDRRFVDDFFVDFIFEACDADRASKHLISVEGESLREEDEGGEREEEGNGNASGANIIQNEADERRQKSTAKGADSSAAAYDTMLHRDSRFWDVISERRKRNLAKIASSAKGDAAVAGPVDGEGQRQLSSKFFGPTIGRRRDFDAAGTGGGAGKGVAAAGGTGSSAVVGGGGEAVPVADGGLRRSIDAFSIGGEFDFLGDSDDGKIVGATGSVSASAAAAMVGELSGLVEDRPLPPSPPKVPKRDELMEALMQLDDEAGGEGEEEETEAIVFNTTGDDRADGETASREGVAEVLIDSGEGSERPSADLDGNDKTLSGVGPEGEESLSATSDIVLDSNAQKTVPNEGATENAEAEPVENFDVDEVGLITSTGLDEVGVTVMEDDEDETYDFDDDDDDLEDLENFLMQAAN